MFVKIGTNQFAFDERTPRISFVNNIYISLYDKVIINDLILPLNSVEPEFDQ